LSTQLWLHKLYGWTRISLMTERFETPICWFGARIMAYHGASLYFHHSWTNWEKHAQSPFALIKDHVLLQASVLAETDTAFKQLLKC
jgi:hypothetical protein